MNKILAALVSMLMILGTIAPALAATMDTTVTDPDTTIEINEPSTYSPIGALTPGSVEITATLTDVNGNDDIALTGYSVTADIPLDATAATFNVVVGPEDNVATLTVSGIIVPYTTSPNDYTIIVTTADDTSDSTTITVDPLIAISATNVNFGDAIPGGPSKIGLSTITNEGNVVVDFDDYGDVGYNNNVDDEITWSALTGSGLDDILATEITTSYDGADIAVSNTGDVSFTLTVPTGILSGVRTGTVTFAPSAVVV